MTRLTDQQAAGPASTITVSADTVPTAASVRAKAAPTAAQLSAALSAAARRLDVDLSEIVTPAGRKARTLAGAGLRARYGASNILLAQLVGVHAPELSPSMLSKIGISTYDLLAISEALAVVEPGNEEAKPLAITPRAPAPQPSKPKAKPLEAKRPRVAKLRPAPVSAPPVAEGPDVARPPRQPVAPLADNLPVFARAVAVPPRRRASPMPRSPERPARAVISRLKAITPPIARWASWFAAAQWDLEEVADLFGVHPDALVDAVNARSRAGLA